jgi:hypothetical protein
VLDTRHLLEAESPKGLLGWDQDRSTGRLHEGVIGVVRGQRLLAKRRYGVSTAIQYHYRVFS